MTHGEGGTFTESFHNVKMRNNDNTPTMARLEHPTISENDELEHNPYMPTPSTAMKNPLMMSIPNQKSSMMKRSKTKFDSEIDDLSPLMMNKKKKEISN